MDLHLSKVFRRIQGNCQSLFILFGGGGCKNEASVTVTLLTSWNHAAVVGVFTGFRSAVTVQGHVIGGCSGKAFVDLTFTFLSLTCCKDKNIQNREILWQCGRKHINGWRASFNLKIFLVSLLASQILSMDRKMLKLLTFARGSWRCSGSPSVMPWPAATATTSQSSTSMCLTSKNLRQRNSSKPLLTTPCEVFVPSWPSDWG